ncbi:hypothetical protein K432DRAFT_295554 [Lepidopterella palustris CBS 459.81]|uniref:Uncharacterized protein n=1 Tax=Lepidopterella palustris CBS 459.81 TaxID=1314670 RepID=A0A8E2ECF1_9PEZI|nr:hypothetical protein K432DRAFT_295554 [Lepidopterella palustris CBS 459.81]
MRFLVRAFQALFFILIPLGLHLTSFNSFPSSVSVLSQLPGIISPLGQNFTNIPFLDAHLTRQNIWIWTVASGKRPGLSLHAYLFAGQFVAGWGVLMLEGVRKGNEGRIVMAIWSFLVEICGFAATVAFLAMIHLSTSATTKPQQANVAVRTSDALSVCVTLICGFVLPSIVIALPTPDIMSYQSKQLAMAVWQGWPLWMCGSWYISRFIFARLDLSGRNAATGIVMEKKREIDMEGLRVTYSFLILVAGLIHVHAWSLSLTATYLPFVFNPSIAPFLDHDSTFFPSPLSSSSPFPATVANFLKYDEIIGVSALFLWTLVMYILAKWNRGEKLSWRLWVQMVIGTTVAGPTTGAAALMWARDEMVMMDAAEQKED